MDKTLAEVLERAETWSQDMKDQLIAYAEEIESQFRDGVYILSADEREAVEESLKQFEAGEIVTEEEMKRVFARYTA